jgi:cation:H+ antiporter
VGAWAGLVLGLLLMLASAFLFTNAMEWAGGRMGLGHAATGGVLAAIGTALPESVVPIVALIHGGSAADRTAIGAILGAPFMLATLGLAVTALFALLSGRRLLRVGGRAARGPIYTFLASYVLLMLGAFAPRPVRILDAILLVGLYLVYVRRTVRRPPGEGEPESPHLLLARRGGGAALGVLQGLLGVAGLAVASELFVSGLEGAAPALHLSALVLALILVPVATELPELVAGGLWVLHGRDGLALGNVTGAMVFQATVPALVGLCFTSWNPEGVGFLAAAVTLSAALLALAASSRDGVRALVLLPSGAGLYALYVLAVALGRS